MVATRASSVGGADYTSGSLREDLANFITLVSAEKTPFISMLATNKASNPKHEWQTDTLADPIAQNLGGAFEFDTANNVDDTPSRLNNFTEVFGKTVHVEGSLLRSNPAGAKNWFQYAINKRKVELRRDIERKCLNYNNFTVDGTVVKDDSGTNRKMGGLAAYAGIFAKAGGGATEINSGTGTGAALATTAGVAVSLLDVTNGAAGSHVPQYAAATSTRVVPTEAMINDVLRVVSENGGMINTAMVPTGLKQTISNLLIAGNGGAAQRRADEMSKRLNLSVDSVLTEFGFDVTIVHNYIMQNFSGDAASSMYMFDSSAVKRTVLQSYDMEEDKAARYGKGAIVFCEETLEVAAPNSVALVTGLGATPVA